MAAEEASSTFPPTPPGSVLKKVLTVLGEDARRVLPMALLFVVLAMLDFMSAAAVGPLIVAFAMPHELPALVARLPLSLEHMSTEDLIPWIGGVTVLLFAVRGLFGYWLQRRIFAFGFDLRRRLYTRMLGAYLAMPYSFHLRKNTAEMVTVVNNMTPIFSDMAVIAPLRVASELLVVFALAALILIADPLAMAMLVLVLGPALGLVLRVVRSRIARASFGYSQGQTQMLATVQQSLWGLKDIRVLGTHGHFLAKAGGHGKIITENYREFHVLTLLPRYLMEVVLVAFIVALSLVYLKLGRDGAELLPTLGILGVAGLRLIPSLNVIATGLNHVRFAREPVNRLYRDYAAMQAAAAEGLPVLEEDAKPPQDAFERLDLRGVAFRYETAEQDALRDVSFSVKRGEAVGLVGPSGAGKTTLVDVILGLLRPTAGDILVNGQSIVGAERQWLDRVAYLPQNVFLIDDTVRRNVALGLPDEAIDEARIRDALERARLWDVVQELPKGLDTVLGDRGLRLSGGQRQRVALARAFYFERDVLVLDEATSALDNEVEAEIVEEIRRLRGSKTLIVIAHRLSTIEHCDTVYRLERGRVVQQGTFADVVGGA